MLRVWVAAALTLAAAAVAEAQFGRGFFGSRVASEKDLTAVHYCRLLYRSGMNGYGGSWRTDIRMLISTCPSDCRATKIS